MKKRFLSLILLVLVLGSLVISVAAAALGNEGIMPCYNNTASTSTNFVISTAGKATITAAFVGNQSVTTGATVTSYIEKRTLGIFWSRVDIGQPNNEWVDTTTDFAECFGHEFWLEKTGTYRATVTYEIRGTGGPADIVNYQQERTYS